MKEKKYRSLFGESGCGKTTCGRTCTGMYNKPDGSVLFIKGTMYTKLSGKEKRLFAKEVQIIFQDPYAFFKSKNELLEI